MYVRSHRVCALEHNAHLPTKIVPCARQTLPVGEEDHSDSEQGALTSSFSGPAGAVHSTAWWGNDVGQAAGAGQAMAPWMVLPSPGVYLRDFMRKDSGESFVEQDALNRERHS
jgi:hypothetical protein